MHQLATTSKKGTSEVKNIDRFVTMQCSAGKPWVLAAIVNVTLKYNMHQSDAADQVHPFRAATFSMVQLGL